MTNPKLRFGFFEPTIDTNRPLVEGTVTIDGFDLELAEYPNGEADAWEEQMTGLLIKREEGAPCVAIPVFPNRKFRHSYIQVNSSAGIEIPKDLEGKRVGIYPWSNPACTWMRGALQNYYKVDLTRVKWLAVKRPGALYAPPGIQIDEWLAVRDKWLAVKRREALYPPLYLPPGIQIELISEVAENSDVLLDKMLVSGELDAVLSPNVLDSITRRQSSVRRLFSDYKTEEQTYFRETGIFPISHVVTLSQEFVNRHPEAPVALLEAYRRARDVAFYNVEGSDPQVLTVSWINATMAEQREVMGENYWAYNVETNRRSLAAATEFAFQQGVTSTRVDYESLFAPEAAALSGY